MVLHAAHTVSPLAQHACAWYLPISVQFVQFVQGTKGMSTEVRIRSLNVPAGHMTHVLLTRT